MTMTQLPTSCASTQCLADGDGRKLTLTEDGLGGRACFVHGGPGGVDEPCETNDVPLAPMPTTDYARRPVESLFGWLQTYNSYATVKGKAAELHCYGS